MHKLLIAGILAATGAVAAAAQSIPDATYSVAAYSVGAADISNAAGTVRSSGVNAYGSSSSTASANSAQSVSAAGTSSGVDGPAGGTPQAFGDVIARYYFEVLGPPSVLVPLLVHGSGNLIASGDGEASVAYSRYMGDTGGVEYQSTCSVRLPYCGGFTYSDTFSSLSGDGTIPGAIASIQLRADSLTNNGHASATIDPLITIDPSFANARLYRIAFSNGVINGGAGAVPEPAAWVMLIVGFGLVGVVLRRLTTAPRAAFTG